MGGDRADRGFADSPILCEVPGREMTERIVTTLRKAGFAAGRHVAGNGEVGTCATGFPVRPGTARPLEQWVSREQVLDEIDEHKQRVRESGDPGSARRVAELYQALHEPETAVAWWRRAAALGDEDALDYVRYTLT